MRLLVLWLHVLAAAVWLGSVAFQAHVLVPSARQGAFIDAFARAARRSRPVTWTAVALAALTGFYNVTRLGPLDRVMESGAGLALAGKFLLVILAVALAGQRDFTQVPRLARTLATGENPASVLRAIAWLDRLVLALGAAIVYLGLRVSRSG